MGRFGWHEPSLYSLATASGQVFERFFAQSQLLGLLSLFCFFYVSHTSLSWLVFVYGLKKYVSAEERLGIAFRQRGRPVLASELRPIKPGEEIVEHQLVRALRGAEQPIGLHMDQASAKFT